MEDNFGTLTQKLSSLEKSRAEVVKTFRMQNPYCRLMETEMVMVTVKLQLAQLRRPRNQRIK